MNARLSPSRITFSNATLALIWMAYALFSSPAAKAQDPPASPLPSPTNNRVQIKIPQQIPEPLSASK
jgi:hypothetical protein